MDLRVRGPLLWAACTLLFALAQSRNFLRGMEEGEPATPLQPSPSELTRLQEVAIAWTLVVILVPALWALLLHRKSIEVRRATDSCNHEVNAEVPTEPEAEGARKAAAPPGVLIASLEHVVRSEGISVVAGGLGKAMKMYSDYAHHSTRTIKFVFPMVGDQEYAGFTPAESILEGSVEVNVLRPGSRVEFIALDHPLFRERDRSTIYPDARRPHQFLTFYSLWNRCIAELLLRYRERGEVGVYHAMDYHGGLAPLYIEQWGLPPFPTAVTLHNALHQGALLATLSGTEWALLTRTLGLNDARALCELEGDFNMLHALVQYVGRCQGGQGITAVSHCYAAHLSANEPIMKAIPIGSHPNPMPEFERPVVPGGVQALVAHKAACKARIQESLHLLQDPSAPLFAFVGRWTYEKGIDLLADAVLWLIGAHPSAQILVVGPIGDEAGQYSAARLAMATANPAIASRLFVRTEFFSVSAEMRFAVDFCLCPSRLEPFGYTDIEFAWHGALCLGYLAGGLGKVPGVYYTTTEPGDRSLHLAQLKRAFLRALAMPAAEVHECAIAAASTRFPVEPWRRALDVQYDLAVRCATQHLDSATPDDAVGHVSASHVAGQPPQQSGGLGPGSLLTGRVELGEQDLDMALPPPSLLPAPAQLQRVASGAQLHRVASGEWRWSWALTGSPFHSRRIAPERGGRDAPSDAASARGARNGRRQEEGDSVRLLNSTLSSESLTHCANHAIDIRDGEAAAGGGGGGKGKPPATPTTSEVTTSGTAPSSQSNSSLTDSDTRAEEEAMPSTVDPSKLVAAVDKEAVASLLQPSGRWPKDIDEVIATAYEQAAGPPPGTSAFGMRMHQLMRAQLFGSAVSNWVVVLLYIVAPSTAYTSISAILQETRWDEGDAMEVYSLQMLAGGVGAYCWMLLSRHVSPPRLLCLAGLAQLSLFAPIYCYEYTHSRQLSYAIAIMQGLASGAVEPVIVGFNFMDRWASTTALAASRMAMADPARLFLNLGMLGVVLGHSSRPASNLLLERLFLGVVRFGPFLVLVLSALCLYLPIRPELRLPRVPTRWGDASRAYWRLVGGDCLGACGTFLDVLFISWTVRHASWSLSAERTQHFYFTAAAVVASSALIACLLISLRHGAASLMVMSAALLVAPFAIVAGVIILASRALPAYRIESLIIGAITLGALKDMAGQLLKMRVLPSRWSFITYQAHARLLVNTIAAFSPYALLSLARGLSPLASLRATVWGSRSFFAIAASFAIAKFAYQLLAIHDLVRERFVPPLPRRAS